MSFHQAQAACKRGSVNNEDLCEAANGNGASFAIVTSRANCVDRILAGLSAASNSCVTALAAFRKLEHAQYSVPCRLNAGLSGLFDVHIHLRSRKNTTSQHDRLCCPI